MDDIAILGGGYAGLGAALQFGKLGFRAILFEKASQLGGLSECCKIGDVTLERFYHHIKPEDKHILELITELGLEDRLRWTRTRMNYYLGRKSYPLSSPLDLLRFPSFSWMDRLSFVRGMLSVKRSHSNALENWNAKDWINKKWSKSIYDSMMGPMLQNKFGIPGEHISAAFLHGRIKDLLSAKSNIRGGEYMGYLHGSLQILTQRLEQEIRKNTRLFLRTEIKGIMRNTVGFNIITNKGLFKARYIVNTLPLKEFKEKVRKNFDFEICVDYQGAICATFRLDKPLASSYWVNIISHKIPFKILVNQSILDDYPYTLIYCGNYVRKNHPLFRKTSEQIRKLYAEGLKSMFGNVRIIGSSVYRTPYATPIFDIDFPEKMKDLDFCIPGMLFAGNIKTYPSSRTINTVLGTGFKAANRIVKQFKREEKRT